MMPSPRATRIFGALTTRLKAEKVDVIYFGGYHPGRRPARPPARRHLRQGTDHRRRRPVQHRISGPSARSRRRTVFTNASDALKNADFEGCRRCAQGQEHPGRSLHAQRLCRGRGPQGRHRKGRERRRLCSRCSRAEDRRTDRDRDRQAHLWRNRRPDLAELLALQVGRRQDRLGRVSKLGGRGEGPARRPSADSEDRRADADAGRAEGDRQLVVAGHAHRQLFDARLAAPASPAARNAARGFRRPAGCTSGRRSPARAPRGSA